MPRRQVMRPPNADEEAMKRDAMATMRSARTDMLIRFPFLGELAMQLKIVPVLDERLPVACTDGEAVYVNAHVIEHPEKAFKKEFRCGYLTGKDDCAVAILAHEVWHCALLHFDRCKGMEPWRFNYASDIEIGHLLKKAGITNLSEATCLTASPGMSAEEIYGLLAPVSFVRRSPFSSGKQGAAASPSEQSAGDAPDVAGETLRNDPGEDGESENDGEINRPGPASPGNFTRDDDTSPSGENSGNAACGKSRGADGESENDGEIAHPGPASPGNGTRDDDASPSGENSGNAACGKSRGADGEKKSGEESSGELTKKLTDGHYSRMTYYPPRRSMTPEFGNKGVLDPDFTPAADRNGNGADKLGQKWRNAVRKAANRHGVPGHSPGRLPGNLKKVIEGDRKDSLDWKQLLLDFVTRTLGGERQWLPPARRYAWKKLYLPRRSERQTIEIVVAVDTSGSTTSELPDFLTELRGMATAFGDYRITIIQCDTAIHSVKEYTGDDPLPQDLAFYGFGGTSLIPPFEYVEKKLPEAPNVLIYLTDGYGDAPKYPPEYPVIWCLTGSGEKPAKWGVEVRINSK